MRNQSVSCNSSPSKFTSKSFSSSKGKSIFLEVSKQNKIAQNFYYKHKFQKVGLRPQYYKNELSREDGYILKGLTQEIINTVS